ncbi:hypothetical protein LK526_11675 [[Clostridium] innocuum]|nr:hypothetical protein [Erysipelatoclostridium sp. DFI.2.3]MCC2792916.1 hypothetical protein [[Clostridium] innocuum]MCC2800889.1 hypothetical protein [[Clostridium] innocuum]MCC2811262.1 hypothetical protein [[Clostridium] innocuum]MCC2823356.1 hypothetical protein [[Clostridium] innocuum]MCC2841340.1 hypothetical protein [[Clostridium] innocuum]
MNNFLFIFRKAGDDVGATSARSIQMDLEIKSDLDKDIQAESSKIADRIRKQVDAMSGDMFKNLRQSLVASLDKMNESVKATLNRTKLEMQAFVEQMAGMVKQMSGVQMPYQKAQSDTEPSTTVSHGPSVRGPPGISIRKPKVKFDPQFDTEMTRQKYAELENMMDMYDNQILAKQAQRKTLLESYKPNMSAQAESALDKQVMGLDTQIAKLQDAAARTNITLSAMNRQMGATSGVARAAGNAILQFTKRLASSALHKFSNGLKSAGQHAASFASRLLGIGSAGKKASNGMGRAHMGVGQLIKSFTIFSLIFPLVSRGIMALAQNIGATLMTNTAFANSLNQIRSNLATAFTPIFQAIMPALNALMSALATVTGYIAAFMSALFGKSMSATKQATSGIYAAKDAMGAYGSSADKAAKASEKARRSLMGFDEINKLDDADDSAGSGGGGGGGSDMPVYTPTDVDDGPIKKWVKQLKDLWAEGDYAGIGKLIGQQVNKAVASFTKWISWDNLGKSITEFCDGFCELFNSLIDTINWVNIGRMFGTGINTIVNTLYLLFTGINWERIGKALAQGLNGLVYSVDWDKLGHTIGSYVQACIDMLYGFVTTADWPAIGKALADGVMGLMYSVDMPKFTAALGKGLSGAISSVHTFVKNIDWHKLGDTIAKSINAFFNNINWADFGMTLSDAAQGILDTLLTAIRGVDWGQIGTDIATFIKNIDWWGIAGSLLQTIIAAVHGIGSGILSLAADLGKWLWDGFCNGVRDFFADPIGFLRSVIVDPIINGIKELFGIHSPSTVFAEIGGYLIEGLKNGIAKTIKGLVTAIPKLFSGLVKAIGNVWTDIKKKAGKAWDGITKSLGDTWSNLKDSAGNLFGKIGDKISSVWNGSDKDTKSAWGSIKGVVADSIDTVRNDVSVNSEKAGKSIEKNFNNARDSLIGANRGMSNDTKNAWGPLVTFVSDKCGSIKNDISRTFKDSKNTVDSSSKSMKSSVTSNLSATSKWISGTMYSDMYNKAKGMMNNFKNGSGSVNVKSTVQSCVNKATSWLSGLGSSSYTWGGHMISGFANGIQDYAYKVTNEVKKAANIVASWLHFTRPDTGPLREYEQWMPHMMEGLGKTLAASTPRFIGQVKSLSQSMSGAMQAALQEPTIAFAGERSLNVQHEWKESQSDTDKTTMKDLIEEVRGLKHKFDEVKEEIRNKDTDVYIDDQKVTKKVVENVNKDTRKNGKCPIDM